MQEVWDIQDSSQSRLTGLSNLGKRVSVRDVTMESVVKAEILCADERRFLKAKGQPSPQPDGGSIRLWWCFPAAAIWRLVRVQEKPRAKCWDILNEKLIRSAQDLRRPSRDPDLNPFKHFWGNWKYLLMIPSQPDRAGEYLQQKTSEYLQTGGCNYFQRCFSVALGWNTNGNVLFLFLFSI